MRESFSHFLPLNYFALAPKRMPTSYRGRFAPSPTGPLHFGSLVAATASFLEARIHQGEWLVRIEDLDQPRTVPGATDAILRTLSALEMHWDGDIMHQSKRTSAYQAALERLMAMGRVYPCGCTRREVADSAIDGIDGPVYPGTCRGGLAPGKAARAMRINTIGARVAFDDAIQGRIEQDIEHDIGDFVLYRADHIHAYQLAVVVDDADQGITHVVRGADLLDSTPRQIYLQQLLGYSRPKHTHIPIAVDPGGQKLSKQTLAAPIDDHRPLPALLAASHFLGQYPPSELRQGGVTAFWSWARANWRLSSVPKTRHLPALDIGLF